MMKQVSIYEVEKICHQLAQEILEWGEPIPNFTARRPGLLESSLMSPFATFGKRYLYRGIWEKAAMLFYLMIKNHPFENGNKRVALVTLHYFLYKNNYSLEINPEKLYQLAKTVAESDPKVRKEIVGLVSKSLEINTVIREK